MKLKSTHYSVVPIIIEYQAIYYYVQHTYVHVGAQYSA